MTTPLLNTLNQLVQLEHFLRRINQYNRTLASGTSKDALTVMSARNFGGNFAGNPIVREETFSALLDFLHLLEINLSYQISRCWKPYSGKSVMIKFPIFKKNASKAVISLRRPNSTVKS